MDEDRESWGRIPSDNELTGSIHQEVLPFDFSMSSPSNMSSESFVMVGHHRTSQTPSSIPEPEIDEPPPASYHEAAPFPQMVASATAISSDTGAAGFGFQPLTTQRLVMQGQFMEGLQHGQGFGMPPNYSFGGQDATGQ